jgi:hypothetical protein
MGRFSEIKKIKISKSKGMTSNNERVSLEDIDKPYEISQNTLQFQLNKTFYGSNEALKNLDEEFKFFNPKGYTYKDFFKLYSKYFYDLHVDTHREFATKSINYAYPEGYENEREKLIRELRDQIKETQNQIDSVENHHFFIKNSMALMDQQFKNQTNSKINEGGGVYFMHSNKKREIMNYQAYTNIKTKLRNKLGHIADEEFIVFLNTQTLNLIPNGPEINSIEDIYLDHVEVNTYSQTPNEKIDD